MSIQRVRREFGAPVTFTDRNVADAKDAYMECVPYVDKTFDLKKIELDQGTQVGTLPALLLVNSTTCISTHS